MVTVTTSKVQYTANGVTTVFAYPFPVIDQSELAVYSGATLKTITTHYTVSGVGNTTGGNVTFLSAPADLTVITIYRVVARTQGTDFTDTPTEAAIDRLTLLVTDLKRDVDRSFKVPVLETAAPDELALASRASKMIEFDSNGQPTFITKASIVDESGIIASAEAAAVSAASASTYAGTASLRASEAAVSAAAASGSASSASTQAGNAASSAATAEAQAILSAASAASIGSDVTTSGTNASNAAASALTASGHADDAEAASLLTAADAIATAADAASTAGDVAGVAASALTAVNAANSATISAATATTQAGNASTSASSASGSASTALTRANAALGYADTAAASAVTASGHATTATTKASEALASADAADLSEASAALALVQANQAVVDAGAYSTTASGYATTATTQAGIATAQAVLAAASAATASAVSGCGNGTFSSASLTGVNSLRSTAGATLALGTGTFGTALTFASATGAATFASTISATHATEADIYVTKTGTGANTTQLFNSATEAGLYDVTQSGYILKRLRADSQLYLYGDSNQVALKTSGPNLLGQGTYTSSGSIFVSKSSGSAQFSATSTDTAGTGEVYLLNDNRGFTMGVGGSLHIQTAIRNKLFWYSNSTVLATMDNAGSMTFNGSILGSGATAPTSTTTGSNVFTAGIATSGPVFAGGIGSFAGLVNSGTFATAGEGNVNSSVSGSGILLGNTNTLTNAVIAATSNRDVIIAHWTGATYSENARFALSGLTTLAGGLTVSGTGTSSFAGTLLGRADATTVVALNLRGRSNSGIDESGLIFTKNDGTTNHGYLLGVSGRLELYGGSSKAITLNGADVAFASTTSGTSTTAAAILGKSLGLTENLFVGGAVRLVDSNYGLSVGTFSGDPNSVQLNAYASMQFKADNGGASGYGAFNWLTGATTWMTLSRLGQLSLTATTTATSTITGAFKVAGGISTQENLWVGGTINSASTITSTGGNGLVATGTGSALGALYLSSVSAGGGASIVKFQDTGADKWMLGYNVSGTAFGLYDYTATAGLAMSFASGTKNLTLYSTTAATAYNAASVTLAGGLGVAGAIIGNGALTIAGTVIHTQSATPASASAAGTVGTIAWDASYIYVCTATNTWKRVGIATW